LIKTAHQHLLLLVGFDTLIYRRYYDTPPILVGHHEAGAGVLTLNELNKELTAVRETLQNAGLQFVEAEKTVALSG
jgi:hypothetical protein